MKTGQHIGGDKAFARSRWISVFILLAIFNTLIICVTVVVGQIAHHRYSQVFLSEEQNLRMIKAVNQLTQALQEEGAPGNDVFKSRDVQLEQGRLAEAISNVSKEISEIYEILESAGLPAEELQRAKSSISGVEKIAVSARVISHETFKNIENGNLIAAERLMANLDMQYRVATRITEEFGAERLDKHALSLKRESDEINHIEDGKQAASYAALTIGLFVCVLGLRLTLHMKKTLAVDREREQILKAIDSASIVAVTDCEGLITEVNDSFVRISGYTRDELVGQNHRVLNSGVHHKSFFRDLWQTISRGQIWTGDITNKNKDGSLYQVRTVIAPIQDLAGRTERYLSIRFDITAQRLLEEEVHKSHQLAEMVQQIAKVGGWELSVDSGKILWTKEILKVFGRSLVDPAPELIGIAGLLPQEREPFDRCVQSCLKNVAYKEVFEFLTPRGETKFIEIVGTPVLNNEGVVATVRGTFQDVTDQKLLEIELKNAQRNAKLGTWKFDHLTGNVTWSSEHYRIFEIEEPQPSKSLFELYRQRIHPEDFEEVQKILVRESFESDSFTFRHRISFDGGSRIKHVRVIGRVVRGSDGKLISIVGTCQDITDLVNAQLAVRESEEEISRFFEVGIDLLCIIDSEGKFRQVNRAFSRLLGYSENELVGQLFNSFLFADDVDRGNKLHAIETPVSRFVNRFRDKSGGYKILSWASTFNEEAGLIYAAARDITEEIASREELESQRNLFDTVLENIPIMIFVKSYDDGLRFKYYNKFGQALCGIQGQQIVGKSDYDFFPKENADFFTEKDREIFRGGKVQRIDREPLNTPQGVKWLETYKVPTYKFDGSPDLLIGISKDITEQLRLEESLAQERASSLHHAKMASLGELSAGVAHEINNPLAIISITIPLLAKFKNDEEKFYSKIEVIKKSVHRIEKIISSLRKYSRTGEKNQFKLENLSLILREVLSLVEAKAKRHDVLIELDAEDGMQISCDVVEIEQVLINLVNNAIDAIKNSQERWVKVQAFSTSSGVAIRITDAGVGIPPEIESKLFQPFFTTKAIGEGTGLGLSIAKGILDNHHATLSLDRSCPHTCFEIVFPADGANKKEFANET